MGRRHRYPGLYVPRLVGQPDLGRRGSPASRTASPSTGSPIRSGRPGRRDAVVGCRPRRPDLYRGAFPRRQRGRPAAAQVGRAAGVCVVRVLPVAIVWWDSSLLVRVATPSSSWVAHSHSGRRPALPTLRRGPHHRALARLRERDRRRRCGLREHHRAARDPRRTVLVIAVGGRLSTLSAAAVFRPMLRRVRRSWIDGSTATRSGPGSTGRLSRGSALRDRTARPPPAGVVRGPAGSAAAAAALPPGLSGGLVDVRGRAARDRPRPGSGPARAPGCARGGRPVHRRRRTGPCYAGPPARRARAAGRAGGPFGSGADPSTRRARPVAGADRRIGRRGTPSHPA